MNFMLFSSRPVNVHGGESYLCDLVKNTCSADMDLDIYRQISFKLGVMIETNELYILIPKWMTLIFIQGHSCMRT